MMSCTDPGSAGGDPEREPVRAAHGLDVTAVVAGAPRVDDVAVTFTVFSRHRSDGDDLAVQDHERHAVGQCSVRRPATVFGARSVSTVIASPAYR